MKLIETRPIAIADIFDRDRLRPVDTAWAEALATNIEEAGGLRTPIEVRALKPNGFALIAGGHRLAAVKILGWAEIPAQIYEASAVEARLREVDENLVRHELNPLDRGAFLLERKALYLKLHPESAQHAAGGHAKAGKVSASDIVSFADDTAERLGWNVKTIERAISIARNLSPESKARVAGTALARNQAELLGLAKLGPAEQAKALDLYFDDANKLPNVRAAIARLSDRPVVKPDQAARLTTAWMHADAKEKTAFLEFVRNWQGGLVKLGWRLERVENADLAPIAPQGEVDDSGARENGYDAYRDGEPRSANPYGGQSRDEQAWAAAWLAGWDEAAAEDQNEEEAA